MTEPGRTPSANLNPDRVNSKLAERFASTAPLREITDPKYVTDLVAHVLKSACAAGASDIHFAVGIAEMQVLWRIDGVLQSVTRLPRSLAPNIIARLKVLAELLTYRTENKIGALLGHKFQFSLCSVQITFAPKATRTNGYN